MTLLDSYFPMAEGPGANSGMDRWRKMGRLWRATGIVRGAGSEFAPSYVAGTQTLTIGSGACWIEGFYGERLGATVISGVTGVGVAVVRFDPAANEMRVVWRPGVVNPEQSPEGIWEMLVCTLSAANVMTDARIIASGGVGEIASRELTAQQLGGGTTPTAINNLQVVLPAGLYSGRRLKLEAWAPLTKGTADAAAPCDMWILSNTRQVQRTGIPNIAPNTTFTAYIQRRIVLQPGELTFNVMFSTWSSFVNIGASPTVTAGFVIEDLGPA